VSRYLICLRDGADLRVMASRIDGPAPQNELLTQLLKQKTAVTLAEMPVRGKVDPREPLERLGLQVLVPMEIQGETRGLVLLGEKLSKAPFTAGDLSFLSSLGNLAVIALENARLFREAIEKQKMEDDLLLAREIQKGLLPSILPEVPGIELAADNVSSRQVGGDYYDVIALGGNRYVIAIGDVSGKGSPASLLMANLQATIRALVPLELSLSELTGRVNDLMCENTGGDKFVTFFWGILDAGARTLVYVNAGHNPPYHLSRDGQVHRLDRGGMILGVLKTSVPYEQGKIHLAEGDILVLFTDGVSEAMNSAGVEYGEERLETILRAGAASTSQDLMRAIQKDVRSYAAEAAQSDDITLMVVRSTTSGRSDLQSGVPFASVAGTLPNTSNE
jgi:sigma-B regulation protein RsbU (phosphoserine phosphatase)